MFAGQIVLLPILSISVTLPLDESREERGLDASETATWEGIGDSIGETRVRLAIG